jgi:hypothetical protein
VPCGSGTPLSICEVDGVRRIEAMDELTRRRADDLQYARLILHMAREKPRSAEARCGFRSNIWSCTLITQA